ncbi:calcium-transporting ATPase 10, plasma membrane-type [Senna tora]|uniref:Calcium-transporting ATPase 10, plasma membrane-type n=1 Tax=Senna tora TaxID=362788 RepID=A0A834SP17_9FABA|nr:calcium-transporting ATPase 10, plasma membrane-type [Senna tora]
MKCLHIREEGARSGWSSPYRRRHNDDIEAGSSYRANDDDEFEDLLHLDPFDIPRTTKNAPVERLKRWRVCIYIYIILS